MERKLIALVLAVVIAASLTACTGTGKTKESDPPASTSPIAETTPEPTQEPTPPVDQPAGPGPCTLSSGFEISLFYKTVRNDVTGKWRLSASSSSVPVSDCAFEYYTTMFLSDDEIHGIWNATLGTMTCIKVMSGMLFVDTYEYVDGEEHDANLMFTGMLLDSKIISKETGEPLEG